jgi:hypothetical protein
MAGFSSSYPAHPEPPLREIPSQSDKQAWGTMAAAPYGSALILPISYAYISLMGSEALTNVSPPCRFCAASVLLLWPAGEPINQVNACVCQALRRLWAEAAGGP